MRDLPLRFGGSVDIKFDERRGNSWYFAEVSGYLEGTEKDEPRMAGGGYRTITTIEHNPYEFYPEDRVRRVRSRVYTPPMVKVPVRHVDERVSLDIPLNGNGVNKAARKVGGVLRSLGVNITTARVKEIITGQQTERSRRVTI